MYIAKAYDTNFQFHFKDDDLETEMISWIFFMYAAPHPSPTELILTLPGSLPSVRAASVRLAIRNGGWRACLKFSLR